MAWVEGDNVFKGNVTEQALLKHMLSDSELWYHYNEIKRNKIQILHWECFDSKKKKSCLIMKYTDGEDEDDKVFVLTKGAPEEVLNYCTSVLVDTKATK